MSSASPRLSAEFRHLEVTSLSRVFGPKGSRLQALEGLTFSVPRGSVAVVVGPSGCGKTTLLRILAGVERPSGGEMTIQGVDPGSGPASTLVFQQDGLLPWMRVVDNVALGLQMRGVGRVERQGRAVEALRRLGLEAFASRFPRELSVGMQQRVALLRALLMETPVLLLDEPFASVDAQTRRLLQEELLLEQQRTRATVILVTHDIDEALLLADTIFVMSDRPGRIIDTIEVALDKSERRDALGSPAIHILRKRIWSQIESSARVALGVA